MHLTPQSRRRAQLGICLLLAFAVAGVSLLFYSPLHQHDRSSAKACSFNQFEHGGFEPPATTVDLPALHAVWRGCDEATAKLLCLDCSALCIGRAPPISIA